MRMTYLVYEPVLVVFQNPREIDFLTHTELLRVEPRILRQELGCVAVPEEKKRVREGCACVYVVCEDWLVFFYNLCYCSSSSSSSSSGHTNLMCHTNGRGHGGGGVKGQQIQLNIHGQPCQHQLIRLWWT